MNASNDVVIPVALTPSPLKDVQNNFSLLDLAGVFYILKRKQINQLLHGQGYFSLSYYKEKEGKLVIRRHLEAQAHGLDDKEVNLLLSNFMKSTNTHVYTEVAFDPRPQPPEVLNLWRPHAVVPVPGRFGIIKQFLLEIICDDDFSNYNYLLNYLAHMLRKPEEKPMVAIILLGGQGIGKGALYNLIEIIWPYTMRPVQSIEEVTGRFTAAALEQSLGVWMDEAVFSGDKKSTDRLKALITEARITIEEKYQPAKTMQSFHRIFGASNHEHFAPTDRDDRRFFFLKVSESWKQNAAKFDPLFAAFCDGYSVPAFVHHLLNLDISTFNPAADRPKTTEHAKQKILSLEGLDRFLYEALQAAEISESPRFCGRPAKPWGDKLVIATDDLRDAIREFDRGAERYKPISAAKLKPDLKKIFPTARDSRFQDGGKSRRGIELPAIQQARKDFEKNTGCAIEWESLDE
ncbi:DUF5906 domain-containing protein [Gammaproteobacteria bacterium]|nr:DUF5906 domain-containing protein [Gammaproteobacteria bacterium]